MIWWDLMQWFFVGLFLIRFLGWLEHGVYWVGVIWSPLKDGSWITRNPIYWYQNSNCLIGWLVGRLVVWLVGWLVGWLVAGSFDRLVDWLIVCLIDWLIDWLVFWRVIFPFSNCWIPDRSRRVKRRRPRDGRDGKLVPTSVSVDLAPIKRHRHYMLYVYYICIYCTMIDDCVIFSIGIDQFLGCQWLPRQYPCGPSNTRNGSRSQGLNHRRPKKNINKKPMEWGILLPQNSMDFWFETVFFVLKKTNFTLDRSSWMIFECRDRPGDEDWRSSPGSDGSRHGWRLCAKSK